MAAITTTSASIVAAILDARLDDPESFFPLQLLFWMRDTVVSLPSRGRGDRWRMTLDHLILSLADLQLITGFALLMAGYATVFSGIKKPQDYQNAHWTLIVYMSCLSSSTHLAAVLTLRNTLTTTRR